MFYLRFSDKICYIGVTVSEKIGDFVENRRLCYLFVRRISGRNIEKKL